MVSKFPPIRALKCDVMIALEYLGTVKEIFDSHREQSLSERTWPVYYLNN